jgi:tungstate transport system ATP-binding protein
VESIPPKTWILSSQNLGQVKRLASRVIYLEQGAIQADLPVWEFFNTSLAESHPKAHAFLKGELV